MNEWENEINQAFLERLELDQECAECIAADDGVCEACNNYYCSKMAGVAY